MSDDRHPSRSLNALVPSTARVYDYWLGGKGNFPVDRDLADRLRQVSPDSCRLARENRAFLTRAARFVARSGIRQFLDIGSGLPTSPNVHEVARQVVPDARVVYVDHDLDVLSHARRMLAGGAGVTT